MVEITTVNIYMLFIGLMLFAILAVFIVYAEASGEKDRKRKVAEEEQKLIILIFKNTIILTHIHEILNIHLIITKK